MPKVSSPQFLGHQPVAHSEVRQLESGANLAGVGAVKQGTEKRLMQTEEEERYS